MTDQPDPEIVDLLIPREQERELIGALLLFPELFPDAEQELTADHFGDIGSRRMFTAFARLTARSIFEWDHGTLLQELKNMHAPEATHAFLIELGNDATSRAHVKSRIVTVKERALQRRVRNLCVTALGEIPHLAVGTGEIPTWLEKFELSLLALTRKELSGMTVSQPGESIAELVEQNRRRETPEGTLTGLRDIDDRLLGMRPGSLTILAARTGKGKSTTAAQIALNVAQSGGGVVFLSLEMSVEELAERMVANLSSISHSDIRSRQVADVDLGELERSQRRLAELPIQVIDHRGTTLSQLRSVLRRIIQKHGQPSLLVVDYLQLMRHPGAKERYLEVGEITRGLRELAREMHVPVIAVAQLSRNAETHQKPKLSDLRESGDIEQAAEAVILLHDESESQQSVTVLIADVAKNRHGRGGETRLMFRKGTLEITCEARYVSEAIAT